MSYILDALRRADAERERGSVPSLHAQSVLPGSPDAAARRNGRPMAWIVATLALALAASLAWHFMSRDAVRETPSAAQVQTASTDTAPSPMAAQSPALAPNRPAQPPALPPVPAARPEPAPAATGAAPAAQMQPRTSQPTTITAATPAAPVIAPPAPPANTTAPAAPTAPAVTTRIPRQEELPEDIRRQLPKFSVGGSIYSESAASRFLILNGQIFHENDKVMPELVLEQIKLKSAVLRFRDQRFTISY